VYPGQGGIIINGKPVEEVLPTLQAQWVAEAPLRATQTSGNVQVVAKCAGGGISGFAGAVSLGISRALLVMDPNLRPTLKAAGLLTRDARVKESKKYGLKRARKAPQYTKR
jgi:small subunit ribosomal protein S9